MRRASALVVAAATALAVSPRQATAAIDAEINLETIGQTYQVATASGVLLSRRRLDQYLGIHLWNIGPKDAFGFPRAHNQFYVSLSLRFETDFSDYPKLYFGGRDVSSELGTSRFELLYGFAGVRDLGGIFDIKLGRLLDVDQFNFTSYDGLSIDAKTPWHLAAEIHAGMLVTGALPFDSPLYRPDGTAPSRLSLHDTDWKPTVGVSLRLYGVRDFDSRVAYQVVFSPAQHTTADERATRSADGISQEKLSWWGRGRLLDGKLVQWVGIRYDVLNGVIDNIQAGLRLQLGPRHSATIEYLYSYPTFDGDSIWNLFVRRQFDDVRASYDLRLGRLRGYLSSFLRFFHDEAESVDRVDPARQPAPDGGNFLARLDGGGVVGARVDLPRGYIRLDGYFELGYGGTRIGVDAATRWKVWRDLLSIEGRLTFAHFVDDIHLSGTVDSFGFVVGALVNLGKGIQLHLLFEDNINRFYTSQLRLYAMLDLTVLLNGRGISQTRPTGIGPGLGGFANPLGTGMGF